jgi:hypothetical protein
MHPGRGEDLAGAVSGSPVPDAFDRSVTTLFTPMLRESPEPRWARLRRRLGEERIDPRDAAIGTLFPDDGSMEFGIVVSRGGRAFAFDFDFLRDSEGNRIESRSDARVVNFTPLDDRQRDFTYARAVRAGLWLLSSEGDDS